MAALSSHICKETKFQQFRRRILPRLPLTRHLNVIASDASQPAYGGYDELLSVFKFMRDAPAKGSPLAETLTEIRKEATHYCLDRVEDGDWLFFQMIVTGQTPDLRDYGVEPALEWRPTVWIPPGEDFDSVLRQVTRLLHIDWPKIKKHWADREWAEKIPLLELSEYSRWFFEVRIKGLSVVALTTQTGHSESTIRRGIKSVERLILTKQ